MNYNLNITRLISQALPALLRSVRQVDWLKAILSPVNDINTLFRSFIGSVNERLKWNGQSIALKALLENRFGGTVTITNNNLKGRPFYVYEPGNNRNPMVYTTGNPSNPLAGEINAFNPEGIDFTVEVPSGTSDERMEEMAALVRAYKLHGKRFTITTLS